MARIYDHKEGQLSYTASAQSTLNLSRDFMMKFLLVKLEVNHTNSSASFKDGLLELINNVQIVANGDKVLKAVPSRKLRLNQILGTGIQAKNSIGAGDGVNVSYEYFVIPFSMFKMGRGYDTILDTSKFKTFDLKVNWGSDASLGTGITVNSAVATVESRNLVGYNRNDGETTKFLIETMLTDEIKSDTTSHQISLPVEKLYKGIQLVALKDGVRDDTIINNITVKSGTVVIFEGSSEMLQAENIVQIRPIEQSDLKGVYVIEFTKRGKLSDCLNTLAGSGFNTLTLELDVTKQGTKSEVIVLSDYILTEKA